MMVLHTFSCFVSVTVLHLGQNPRELEPTTNRFQGICDLAPHNFFPQVLIQIEGLYLALLNLESDQLKLHALPTGAPLREQVYTLRRPTVP